MHGEAWTGEPDTAAAQFRHEVTAKTNEAVGQGQHDVEEAKAVGAGYVEQAKTMAGNVLATAQVRTLHLIIAERNLILIMY